MLYAGQNNIPRIIKELYYYNNINIDTIYKLIYKMYYINRNIKILISIIIAIIQALLLMCACVYMYSTYKHVCVL